MDKHALAQQRFGVIGLGISGCACLRYLLNQGATVTGFDRQEILTDLPQGADYQFGDMALADFADLDMLVVSPGVPLFHPVLQQARETGIEVIGDVELFARLNTTPVIAITGSNGKSTVTSLCAAMLEAAGKHVLAGGNLGTPVFDLLESDAELLVLELSSFQLESLSSLKPMAATVLNISEDHLDRYPDFAAYRAAKQRIYRGAVHCVANLDDANTLPEAAEFIGFSLSENPQGYGYQADGQRILHHGEAFIAMADCQLMGLHNVANIQAAAALAHIAGADDKAIIQAAQSYAGLPHRCQRVARVRGVDWVNDSKATNVAATLAAISGLKPMLTGDLHLIAGGIGKGADFTPLKAALNEDVSGLFLLGRDAEQIAALRPQHQQVGDLAEAVRAAAALAKAGDAVLLSPACSSLDMFRDYQQRGDCFAQLVQELAA